jgi:predicted nucleic acid-binding protein
VIVPDASVVLDLLLRLPGCETIERRLFDSEETLHAPHLLDLEVAPVLRRYAGRREIDAERGRASLELLTRFPLRRYPHEPLVPRIWALRANLTAYDAAYVALAEGLGATLVTRDRKLAAVAGHSADVEIL